MEEKITLEELLNKLPDCIVMLRMKDGAMWIDICPIEKLRDDLDGLNFYISKRYKSIQRSRRSHIKTCMCEGASIQVSKGGNTGEKNADAWKRLMDLANEISQFYNKFKESELYLKEHVKNLPVVDYEKYNSLLTDQPCYIVTIPGSLMGEIAYFGEKEIDYHA